MAARAFAAEVLSSPWWRMQRYRPVVQVDLGGHEVGDMVASHSYPLDGEVLPTAWVLSLHPDRATERSVIHELAHVLAPRFELCDDLVQPVQPHGPEFAGVYVEMLNHFSRREDPADLIDAFGAFGVAWLPPDEWRNATARSLSIEQDLVDGRRRRVPVRGHHFGIELRRRRAHLGWTPARLGRQAQVVATEVTRIETLAEIQPEDRLPALRLAACVGIDQVLLKDVLGLRWSEDELEELRVVAPAWAATVDEMNEVLRRWPPWWETSAYQTD
jgi:hypothetical protein